MSNRRLLVFLAVTLVVSLTGCGRMYDLAISMEGSGEISPGPGIHEYKPDTPVALTVTPAAGWGFVGWSGPNGNMVIDQTIIMDRDKYITAVFARLEHQLDVSVEPAGAGTVDVVIVPASRGIEHGQKVRLTAVPKDGYVFECWDQETGDTVNPKSLVMDAAKSVKAVFKSLTYDLAINVEGEGETSPGPGVHKINRDTPVTMTITPATGWGFAGWGGLHGNAVLDNTIFMSGNKYITAVFAKLQHELNVSIEPEEAGMVDLAIVPMSRGFEHGQTVRLTAVPNKGYIFECWNDNSGDIVNPKSLVMDAPKSIKATFSARVADPVFSLSEGTYDSPRSIGITCATGGATIRYTTDGITTPSSTVGTLYSGSPLQLSESAIIKAVAYKQGLPDSAVVTRVYTLKAPAPTAGLSAGTYEGTQSVTLASPGMTIRYTLDGTAPSPQNGVLYTGPITMRDTTTLKAVAYRANLSPSDVVTQVYTINHWPTRAPMPTARKGLAAVGVGGKIYAIGGFDGTSYLNTVEVYDPNKDEWFTRASMPTARAYLSAVTINGYIYAIGGRTASEPWVKTVEMYDPYTNTWTSKADMTNESALFTAVEINGIIHVVGGCYEFENGMTFTERHQEYDPATDTWAVTGSVPPGEALCMYGAAAVGDKAYFIGGYGSNFSSYQTRIYDTVLKSWHEGAYGPASQQLAAAVFNGRIYAIGGLLHIINNDTIIREVHVYDPLSNIWSNGPSLPTPIYLHAAATVSNRLFVLGGTSSGGIMSDILELKL